MQVFITLSKETKVAAWWKKLSDKEQEVYVKQHPNSKYAKLHKAAKIKERKPKQSLPKKHIRKLKIHWKKFTKEQKKMFKDGDHLPNSKERKGFKSFIKRKAKGVVKALKHEVKEWKEAGGAVRKLVNGKKPNDHEKKALKTVALHVGMVVGPMALSGGLSGGLAAVSKGIGLHLLEHTALIRGVQIAAFASESADAERSDEELLELLVKQMADAMASADISIDDWVKMALEAKDDE